ncbi:hypothetical protein CC80DRAFT_535856 [Byssothecium circinans]|uniref:Uncharacterized protein n=1 Tax=Byssothecium circinans TaxID=147558 RepID=A0A6A5TTQ6_9PLEO|nr:hypothetical protein CC80DRAFT_535856 [Byssothecium circinans]
MMAPSRLNTSLLCVVGFIALVGGYIIIPYLSYLVSIIVGFRIGMLVERRVYGRLLDERLCVLEERIEGMKVVVKYMEEEVEGVHKGMNGMDAEVDDAAKDTEELRGGYEEGS